MRTRIVCAVICLSSVILPPSSLAHPPPLINYQGRLVDGTNLVNGTVGLSLRLFDAPAGGTLLYEDSNTVTVVDGLYAATIGDNTTFGTLVEALANTNVFVEVAINGTPLAPRERLQSVPYALQTHGLHITANQGIVFNPVDGNNNLHEFASHSVLAGGFNNQIHSNVDYAVIGGGRSHRVEWNADYSRIGGGFDSRIGTNAQQASIGGGYNHVVAPNGFYATIPGGYQNFATNDGFAAGRRAKARHTGAFVWGDSTEADVESAANDQVTFRAGGGFRVLGGAIEGDASGLSNFPMQVLQNRTSATGSLSFASGNIVDAEDAFVGGGDTHTISSDATGSVIAGGSSNLVASEHGAIAGGQNNRIEGGLVGSASATIGGGANNVIEDGAFNAVIGGGSGNRIEYTAWRSVIAGGWNNRIATGATYGVIGGGRDNTIASGANYAVIAGGWNNEASGNYSFAAGRHAKAWHEGSFVWADAQGVPFGSATTHQFLVRAANGVGINVTNPVAALHVVSASGDAGILVAPPVFTSGDNSYIDWAEDHDGTFGMRWFYDGAVNRFQLYGKNTMGLIGPHITVNRDNGRVGIGTNVPLTTLHVAGTTRTDVLEITGGSDVAEPFNVTGDAPPVPGTVLCIDPQAPGQLRISDRPYDRTVAGVASGANDLPPGLILRKEGSAADGACPVALSGRVYCLVDADAGPVEPGDLLTTSDRPGHAMKVADSARAQGAILGKAMTPLAEGQGMVLILVTLQ